MTFPLPYGFTAFSMDGTDAQYVPRAPRRENIPTLVEYRLSMALFNFSEEQDDAPLMLDGFVVQMSQTLFVSVIRSFSECVNSF